MNDMGNLQNLNDIVMPDAAPWWPLAPGWYVLAAVVAVVLVVLFIRWQRNRLRNRYRVQALHELSLIRQDGSAEALQALPALLKRTALAAWPRAEVAALSGPAWHHFLDDSAAMDRFCSGAGATLDWLAYTMSAEPAIAGSDREQVLDAAELWLKQHANPAGSN